MLSVTGTERYIILPHPLLFPFMLPQSYENCTVKSYSLDLKAHNSNFGHYENARHVFSGHWTPSASKVQSSSSLIYNATINKTVAMLRKIKTKDNYVIVCPSSLYKIYYFCCLIFMCEEITAGSSHRRFSSVSLNNRKYMCCLSIRVIYLSLWIIIDCIWLYICSVSVAEILCRDTVQCETL